jgi:cell pole-organizing protein PopZ
MEEILASIRKIISDDANETSPPPVQPEGVATAVAEPEVLELTQEVHETHGETIAAEPPGETMTAEPPVSVEPPHVFHDASPPASIPEAVPSEAAPHDLEPSAPIAEAQPSETMSQQIEEPPVSSPAEAPVHSSEGIFSDKTRKALDETFAGLVPDPSTAVGATAPVAPVDGPTVTAAFDRAVRETFEPVLQKWLDDHADMVVERMKPLIGEWLDEHFPAMLEDAVRGEVARIAKTRVRR